MWHLQRYSIRFIHPKVALTSCKVPHLLCCTPIISCSQGPLTCLKPQLSKYSDYRRPVLTPESLCCRDHRKIGQELDLFSLNESAGAGLVFWHPKGALVRHLIETHWKTKHMEAGYQLIYTPHVASATLWQRSGHLDFYRENMFDQMQVRPHP